MQLDDAPVRVRNFWQAFDPERVQAHRFYEPFQVGLSETDADHGARLILDGSKTATSSLLWEYEHSGRALPAAGTLSMALDGRYAPVCIIETTEVLIIPFDQVDAAFCSAYAEGDGTVDGWRALTWPIYQIQCHTMGRLPSMHMPLVCEYMTVIYPRDPAARRSAIEAIDAVRG